MRNKKNLLEDLKRHKQLLEYNFYAENKDDDDLNGELLLDDMITEQDPPGDEEEPIDMEGETPEGSDNPFGDLEGLGAEGGEEPLPDMGDELPVEDDVLDDPFLGMGGDVGVEDEFAIEPEGDTVEVDVTDIVDKTEETKNSVDHVSTKMDSLLSKFGDLESQVSSMDDLIVKIDDLEKEFEKRNPTPLEKLEMRSMDSFPYNVSLPQYWEEKEGYDVGGEEEEEEYILRQSDIENFNDREIKNSFNK
tara:strand:- start:11015 stop:11758 length:744 start_codon:yes stop_codon:yes gene_type:complete